MPEFYILRDRVPVRCYDPDEWGLWSMTPGNRLVARTEVGALTVSTVFVGIDFAALGEGPPLMFETMIFSGDDPSTVVARYETWALAQAGHAETVDEQAQALIAAAPNRD